MDEAKRQPEWKNTFRVGNYTCEMIYNEGGGTLKVKWRPDVPRRLSDQAWDEYRAGRSWARSQRRSGMCSLSKFDARLAATRQQ
jgi:hypothetical protein